MDPISIGIELELGALILAAVGAIATWLHNRNQKATRRQRERHHREHLEVLASGRLPAQEGGARVSRSGRRLAAAMDADD
jgi:hypothetical protein